MGKLTSVALLTGVAGLGFVMMGCPPAEEPPPGERITEPAPPPTDPARPMEPDPMEPDPMEPDPMEPDPMEPDPMEPDPMEPDPMEPEPQPAPEPDPYGPGGS